MTYHHLECRLSHLGAHLGAHLSALLACCALLSACDSSGSREADPPLDSGLAGLEASLDQEPQDIGDQEPQDMGDQEPQDMGNQDMSVASRPRVELPSPELLPAPENTERARVRLFKSEREEDLINGPTRLGRIGDYVFESERGRFVIEADARVIGPCPYGGNLIDAERIDLPSASDQLGELCPLINLAQTLKPERFEILEDGSEGRALLAVTGRLELLDFINIKGFARSFLPPTLRLGFDTERLLPLSVTIYYALTPSASGLRVLTALRNDGEQEEHFPVGHLIDSGGEVTTFSPYSPTGGFGSPSFSADTITTGPALMALAFTGDKGGHLYMPDPREALRTNRPFPVAGTYLTISGVSVSLLGTQQLLTSLLASPATLPTVDGFLHMSPGDVEVIGHWHWVGGSTLSSMMDEAWREVQRAEGLHLRDVQGGVYRAPLSGEPSQGSLTPLSGVRVTLIDERDQALTQAITDEEGLYHLTAPLGAHKLRLWREGYGRYELGLNLTAVEGSERGEAPVINVNPVSLSASARLRVEVNRSATNTPTPARVSVLCDPAPCADVPDEREADLSQDRLHPNARWVGFAGLDGVIEADLPPGDYRVVVSRGPHWSVWPSLEGERVTLEPVAPDEPPLTLRASIDEAIDRTGWRSADLHVHGINSPDAPVSLKDRVLSFLAEGVDVLVSTDHDYITDYSPTIRDLGADQELKHIVGVELTTFDYGHYNSFPLPHNPTSRNGGAFDWAGGEGLGATPAEIFSWMRSHEGEQVVMINHARGGYFSAMKIDLLRGQSEADATLSRLPETDNLWDEGFTAMEVYNGYNLEAFHSLYRAWLTLLGRGYKVTATAVSDTHKLLSTTAGGPRSWVYLGAEANRWDEARFVSAINEGRLVGSNGPLLTLEVRALLNGAPQSQWARVGDTLTLSELLQTNPAEAVSIEVRVRARCPAWMSLTSAAIARDVTEGLDVGAGEFDPSPVPHQTLALTELSEGDEGGPQSALERVYEAHLTAPPPAEGDGYLVAWVEGEGSMFPVTNTSSVRPFAFTNAVLIDADGNGYNTPPLRALLTELEAQEAQGEGKAKRRARSAEAEVGAITSPSQLTSEELEALEEAIEHKH